MTGSDCPTGKEQFTRDGARERARSWHARGDAAMRHYRCLVCGCFHIGHRRRADKRRAVEGARR